MSPQRKLIALRDKGPPESQERCTSLPAFIKALGQFPKSLSLAEAAARGVDKSTEKLHLQTPSCHPSSRACLLPQHINLLCFLPLVFSAHICFLPSPQPPDTEATLKCSTFIAGFEHHCKSSTVSVWFHPGHANPTSTAWREGAGVPRVGPASGRDL